MVIVLLYEAFRDGYDLRRTGLAAVHEFLQTRRRRVVVPFLLGLAKELFDRQLETRERGDRKLKPIFHQGRFL